MYKSLKLSIFLLLIVFMFYGCPKRYVVDKTTQTNQNQTQEQNTNPDISAELTTPEPNIRDKNFVVNANLQKIHFDYDKAEISPENRAILEENAKWIKANPDVFILIEGHADDRGTYEYNLALGQERATKVREYLVYLGVSASKLGTISYGEEKPAILGENEKSWYENRRVEFLSFKNL
jgi:peptidoglycan-associated lipoprotein